MGAGLNELGTVLPGGAPNNAMTTATGAGGQNTSAILNPTTANAVTGATGTATGALTQQQGLINALQGTQATSATAQAVAQQQNLAQALQAQAMGQGPNPAMAQLAQTTGQNVSNTGALMAGQRGAGSNVGLIARQAGQTGAGIQQAAVGQGATMEAQQQIAAEQALANLSATQVGQTTGATQNLTQAATNEQANVMNAVNAQNNANVGMQGNVNAGNIAMGQTNANNTQAAVGGLTSGAGAASSMGSIMAAGATGGEVKKDKIGNNKRIPLPDHLKLIAVIHHPKHYADGGYVPVVAAPISITDISKIGNSAYQAKGSTGSAPKGSQKSTGTGLIAGGPGDQGSPDQSGQILASKGAVVPGKPKVDGKNTVENDKVPALLTPKEIVLPLSVTEAKDAPQAAYDFVARELQKKNKGKSDGEGFKAALKTAIGSRKK